VWPMRSDGGEMCCIEMFARILLMAADADDDAFEHPHKLRELPRLGRRVSVCFNRNDRAMALSDATKGNPDRLGDDGPRAPCLIPAKVSQIDCTRVADGVIEHSYYLDSDEVVRDMSRVPSGEDPKEIADRTFLEDRNRFVLAR
jgi:esterase/lipase superfamily enzyme